MPYGRWAGVPREQKTLKGHLPRVMHHQVYVYTKKILYGHGGCFSHPGDNTGVNLESIYHRCHPILVALIWELTDETIHLPLGCLQGGLPPGTLFLLGVGVLFAKEPWRLTAPPTASPCHFARAKTLGLRFRVAPSLRAT